MSTMGKYCKAYSIDKFRAFAAWSEDKRQLRKQEQKINGDDLDVQRELTEWDHLYLQEDLTVTDGIFKDENIVFGKDKMSPEWVEFCEHTLLFVVPVYEPMTVAPQRALPATETSVVGEAVAGG